MIGLCISSLAAAVTTFVSTDHFSLSWQHSIEHFIWKEEYKIDPSRHQFYIDHVFIPGHGAGVDIPPDAVFIEDHWEFQPVIHEMPELLLANWLGQLDYQICTADNSCHNLRDFLALNDQKGVIRLFVCDQ